MIVLYKCGALTKEQLQPLVHQPGLIFKILDQLYENKYVIIIQLADIPGMERYESCCDNHFRNCHGALLLSDSTDIDSLERTELYWYKQLQTKGATKKK